MSATAPTASPDRERKKASVCVVLSSIATITYNNTKKQPSRNEWKNKIDAHITKRTKIIIIIFYYTHWHTYFNVASHTAHTYTHALPLYAIHYAMPYYAPYEYGILKADRLWICVKLSAEHWIRARGEQTNERTKKKKKSRTYKDKWWLREISLQPKHIWMPYKH